MYFNKPFKNSTNKKKEYFRKTEKKKSIVIVWDKMQSYLQIIIKKSLYKKGIENLRPFRCKDNETLLFQDDGEKDSKEQYWSSESQE